MNFGTVVISTFLVFGGIPSTRELICPSISNVLPAPPEVCANAFFDISSWSIIYKGINNIKRLVKIRVVVIDNVVVMLAMKYHLLSCY
jgi:hypothetical protein